MRLVGLNIRGDDANDNWGFHLDDVEKLFDLGNELPKEILENSVLESVRCGRRIKGEKDRVSGK